MVHVCDAVRDERGKFRWSDREAGGDDRSSGTRSAPRVRGGTRQEPGERWLDVRGDARLRRVLRHSRDWSRFAAPSTVGRSSVRSWRWATEPTSCRSRPPSERPSANRSVTASRCAVQERLTPPAQHRRCKVLGSPNIVRVHSNRKAVPCTGKYERSTVCRRV